MELKFHIPTQQYGFLEVTGGVEDRELLEELYNYYAETPIQFGGDFKEVVTFTGETVLYNDKAHKYTTTDGVPLISGSEYKKSLEKPFDSQKMSGLVGKKYGVSPETVLSMWKHNSNTSTNLGNALHSAMEQYFKYKDTGTDKQYHLPKHPFLAGAVESFPDKEATIMPEIMVSDVVNLRVGQIDALKIVGEKAAYVMDFKTDAKIKDNVDGHFNQLSFYAHILMAHDWNIKGLIIWNYTDKWTSYESEVLGLL